MARPTLRSIRPVIPQILWSPGVSRLLSILTPNFGPVTSPLRSATDHEPQSQEARAREDEATHHAVHRQRSSAGGRERSSGHVYDFSRSFPSGRVVSIPDGPVLGGLFRRIPTVLICSDAVLDDNLITNVVRSYLKRKCSWASEDVFRTVFLERQEAFTDRATGIV